MEIAAPLKLKRPVSKALERIPQRELNQARLSERGIDLAEGSGTNLFDVCDLRIAEVRVVPDVEEVSSKAQRLPLSDLKILDRGKVPVLLERSVICVALQISEPGGAKVLIVDRVAGGCGIRRIEGIQQRSRRKRRRIQIPV